MHFVKKILKHQQNHLYSNYCVYILSFNFDYYENPLTQSWLKYTKIAELSK